MKKDGNQALSKIIRIEGVGDVLIERSRRARNICLSIKPCKEVRVAVPVGVSFEQAEAVAMAKAGWIARHLRRLANAERDKEGRPPLAPINRAVARRVIVDRLEELARRYGFVYSRVFVRNQKTRWGSCSAQNNINLNVNLIRLPGDLRDYVIFHELVHTRVKNHGPRFWEELERYVTNCRQVDKELSRHDFMLWA